MRIQIGNDIVELKVPQNAGKLAAIIGGGILLLIIGVTSIYTIQVEERGVVLRFGKHVATVDPGLHFRLPFGIDRVIPVAVRRQQKMEFGSGSAPNSRSRLSINSEQELERNMVTGDLNAALVEWVIQYRITEPDQYLFKARSPDDTLRDASESVMRQVVGDRTVDEVITFGRQEIESVAAEELRTLANLYQLGISIDQVQLQDVDPPQPVQASFNEVNQAQQDKEKSVNIANGEYNRAVPKARGEAEKQVTEAEGYATQRVNEAQGDVARFVALLAEYEKAPDVTRRRIYLETMEEVMPKVGRKVVIDESADQVLPFLPLSPGGGVPVPAAK
ncbi:MAG: FtsH protease activity modulator HflK [Verrucomicrobiota bacterium]